MPSSVQLCKYCILNGSLTFNDNFIAYMYYNFLTEEKMNPTTVALRTANSKSVNKEYF